MFICKQTIRLQRSIIQNLCFILPFLLTSELKHMHLLTSYFGFLVLGITGELHLKWICLQ